MDDKSKRLLDILFDNSARVDERDDAAIDLAKYHTIEVLERLIDFACKPEESNLILASVGESIGEIMIAINKFDSSSIQSLTPIARKEALSIIKAKKQGWLE